MIAAVEGCDVLRSGIDLACDVLGFAFGNELWLADVDTLHANMLEAWESLTDEERADYDANFQEVNEQLNSCFEEAALRKAWKR